MNGASAFRVFWKTKEWDRKKSTFDSEEDTSFILKKKRCFQKKDSGASEGSADDEEQLVCQQGITFPCSICKQEVETAGAFVHKQEHIALAALGLQWRGGKKQPASKIVAQRQILIANLLSSSMLNEKVLQSINNAFELLWHKRIPVQYKIFDTIHRSYVYSQKIYHLLIKGVAVCEDRISTRKTEMNDNFMMINNFGNKPNVCFFSLFDGHQGASAADFMSAEFPVLLLHQLSKFDPCYQMTPEQQQVVDSFDSIFREDYTAIEDLFSSTKTNPSRHRCNYEDTHKAFAKAFWRMDKLLRLGRKEGSRVLWSGCSVVTCILEGKIKYPYANMNWKKINSRHKLAESFPSQMVPQIISGILHIANTGNVQAVLCRNGKGFCLTKEHTTENTSERRRVLQSGALITSTEPYGLLEGQTKTTRGLGFHGDLKLKKFIIPAPETISVPIDDLCQFLILATNGLWEVLDKEEVIALTITLFQIYKETCAPIIQNKSQCMKPLYLSISDTGIPESESNIHVLFQYNPESNEYVSTTNLKTKLSDLKYSEHFKSKNVETFPPQMTNHEACREEETASPPSADNAQTSEEDSPDTRNFFEGAAEYISRELVNAALEAGSRDNITVMVIFLNGSEYQLLM
ncbi:PREDICTED: protein phosphatase 2C-like domain-containing protein 1 [Chinchilla lanigera]|uniref:Protein phosphatase 2C like domain containing 1 n=1 Tax=Chinchilla lanigera TaxID=34839 RepID=A0A8C2V6V3_CHILA|nr:PREDICTED: protein phosphatase 2C-like domain-containing protein 1 [Chinchilla lanigera]